MDRETEKEELGMFSPQSLPWDHSLDLVSLLSFFLQLPFSKSVERWTVSFNKNKHAKGIESMSLQLLEASSLHAEA